MWLTDLVLGFVLVIVGAGSGLLSAAYWRPDGLTLLSFSMFALLYGSRLIIEAPALSFLFGLSPPVVGQIVSTIHYALPVPGMLFVERLLGPGWRSSLRRLWQVWIGVAVVFGVLRALVDPAAIATPYRILVTTGCFLPVLAHVLWWGPSDTAVRRIRMVGFTVFLVFGLNDNLVGLGVVPWPLRLETMGLSALILSLGYVTARQFFSNQRELAVMEYELQTASAIQTSILPRTTPKVDGLEIAVRYVPMRAVGGDLYDFSVIDSGAQIAILVADVTGHGVPAALIASMAKVAFASQSACADQPGPLLGGMNRALCGHLEAQFVTATYVHIDRDRRQIRYSNAGHPPPLLWRSGPRQVVTLTEGGVLLGFDASAAYPTTQLAVGPGDRLVLYTDGMLDVTNAAGDFFGEDGLKAFLEDHSGLTTVAFADALLGHLRRWSGRDRTGSPFEDDLTLAILDIGA